jgi:hypothetical protein
LIDNKGRRSAPRVLCLHQPEWHSIDSMIGAVFGDDFVEAL